MKNLGRTKVTPSTSSRVQLDRGEMDKLRKAFRKGGSRQDSPQVKEAMLKLSIKQKDAITLLEADFLEDGVRYLKEYGSSIDKKLLNEMTSTWFEKPVQAAAAKIFSKTPQEITSVSHNEIVALKEMVSQFSVEQIKFFRKAHIQALPLEYLTPQQLQALSPKQKSYLLPEQLEKLSQEKRAFLQ